LSSAELYDPATGTFSYTGSLVHDRGGPSGTLLPNGQALIVAGFNNNGRSMNTAELYNPASGTFSYTTYPLLQQIDDRHTATLLPNGKVLIIGGWDDYNGITGGSELYNPSTGGFSWAAGTGPGSTTFLYFTATLMQNGKVLDAGGRCFAPSYVCTWGQTTKATGLYDSVTDSVASTPPLPHDLAKATATLLQSGKVLVAGGVNNDGTTINISELYTPGP